ADAPGPDVREPLRVDFLPVPRKETNEMIANHIERFLCFRVTQKPLLAQTRLDRHFAPLTEPDVVLVRLFFREQVRLRQQFSSLASRLKTIQTVELRHRRTIDPAVRM